jgi:chitinase
MDDAAVTATVNDLRGRGGTLTVASGGAQGPYLENVCPDAGSLSGAYAQALDAVGANRLDVDVEADVPEDTVAEALADLQRTRRTEVMLTVQVEDQRTGITPEGMALARAAVDAGLDARINVMVMNFPPTGPWLPAMTEALDAAQRQVGALEPGTTATEAAAKVGATVMIGRNDMGMTTTLSDAAALTDYADARGLGFVGFWSAGRDNGGCPDAPQARPDCSGVAQAPYAFAQTLGRVQARPPTNR